MNIRTYLVTAATVAAISMISGPAAAITAKERGTKTARAVELEDRGYGDEVVTGEMVIRSPDNTTAHRVFKMYTLEVLDGGDKRVVVFEEPRDLAGFVSLNHSQILKPDKQWIYLPAIGRSRRLSARDKTGAFAGSEFTYEDIVKWEFERYDYEFLREETCAENTTCEVIVDYPRYEYSGYSKLVESIDMEIMHPRKIVYHDRQGRPFKTLELIDYRQFADYWRPMKLIMTNHVTGAVSEITWSDYRFDSGLKHRDFKPSRIENWAKLN